MENKYDYVLAELKRRKGQLTAVANDTGISRRTIGNIVAESFKPRLDTLDSLYDYLKKKGRGKGASA